MIDVTGDC